MHNKYDGMGEGFHVGCIKRYINVDVIYRLSNIYLC